MAEKKLRPLISKELLAINRKEINTPTKNVQFPKGDMQIPVNLTIKDRTIENIMEIPSVTFQINKVKRTTTQAMVRI